MSVRRSDRRRARKRYRCDGFGVNACTGWILPGETYHDEVASPGWDGITDPLHWSHLRLCGVCKP